MRGRAIGGSSPSCWDRSSLLFQVRGEARKPEPEDQRADSRGGVLGGREASHLPTS